MEANRCFCILNTVQVSFLGHLFLHFFINIQESLITRLHIIWELIYAVGIPSESEATDILGTF